MTAVTAADTKSAECVASFPYHRDAWLMNLEGKLVRVQRQEAQVLTTHVPSRAFMDADRVWFKRLWLGSVSVAGDDKQLCQAGITHVMSVSEPVSVRHRPDEYRCWIIRDDPQSDLLRILRYTTEWITHMFLRDDRPDLGLLVHCADGVSRSAAVIVAWMISLVPSLTPDSAQALLRQHVRPCVNINPGFMRQLWEWRRRQLALERKRVRSAVCQIVALMFRNSFMIGRCVSTFL